MSTTTALLTTVSFSRLRSGDWGIKSSTEIRTGERVLAVANSGRRSEMVVGRIVWTDNSGAWIAEATRAPKHEAPASIVRATATEIVRETKSDTIPAPAPEALTEPNKGTVECGKRPFIRVTETTAIELGSWEPVKREVFYQLGGDFVRAGEQFSIVRPGHLFPLGHSSDHRRVVSHNATRAAIMAGPVAAGQIEPGRCYVAGHGYHVAQTFDVRHMSSGSVAGVDVTHKLVVSNDHTGAGAMRASLVCYVGLDAIGAVATARGRHVANDPEVWQGKVDAMIETAILHQDEILDLLTKAAAHVMTDEDRKWLRKRGVIVKRSAYSALDAFRAWHNGIGRRARPSWGVWARRLDGKGLAHLRAMLERPAAEKPGVAKAA